MPTEIRCHWPECPHGADCVHAVEGLPVKYVTLEEVVAHCFAVWAHDAATPNSKPHRCEEPGCDKRVDGECVWACPTCGTHPPYCCCV